MAILGLVSTESYAADRFTNIRRSVFYHYPGGAAPLVGILSLLDEETTNDPEFSWWEKRLASQRSLTIAANAVGPFMVAAGTALADLATMTAPAATGETATKYRIAVASTAQFRTGHVIKISTTRTNGTLTGEIKGVITAVVSATVLEFYVLMTVTSLDNGAGDNIGQEVLVIGSAYGQGTLSNNEQVWNTPLNIGNYTQIFKTAFSMSGTAVKTAAKYDKTGPYKDKAKEHSIYHMIEIERALMFGPKGKYVPTGATDPANGTGLPLYTTGGVLHFLERWEAGDYGPVSVANDDADDKRIIVNASGTLTHKKYNSWLERVFRVTNNMANEKLVFCGSGFLSVINQMYESKACLTADLPMTDTFGMNMVKHVTPFGTIFYKTHPLFTQNPILRNCALILDVRNMRYRYIAGRDTELLKEREPNNADYRMDEWLTECGLELRFPESCMYIQNVLDFTP